MMTCRALPLRLSALLAAGLMLASPGVAAAQGASSAAAAQELFERGRALMEKGNYAEACPKLAASNKLDPGAGTQLNLASCYEKNGQTASAWVTYKDAATSAGAAGRADWAAKATGRARALEPSLSRLSIGLPAGMSGLTVQRDGVALSEGELGVALPVDPGSHAIQASAPGKQSWSTTVEVGKAAAVTVEVPVLADVPALVATGPAPPVKAGPPAETTAPPPAREGSAQRVAGVAIAGLGVVGVALGSVLGLQAKSKHDEALDEHCRTATICTQAGADLVDEARTSATISTVAFGVGAAALAGGAVLFFTAPKGGERAGSAVAVGFGAAPGAARLQVGGAF